MLPELPQELIECILIHLCHRTIDLKSCSVVSRAWVPFCRRYLFQNLCLDWSKEDSSQGNSEAFLLFQDQSPGICRFVLSLTITGSDYHARNADISLEDFALLIDSLENLKAVYLSRVMLSIDSPVQPMTHCRLNHLSIEGLAFKSLSRTQSATEEEWMPVTHPLISFLRIFSSIEVLSVGECYITQIAFGGQSLEAIGQTLMSSTKVGVPRLDLIMPIPTNCAEGTIAFLECLDLGQLGSLRVVNAYAWQIEVIDYIAKRSPNLTQTVLQLPNFLTLEKGDYWNYGEHQRIAQPTIMRSSGANCSDWDFLNGWSRSPLLALPHLRMISIEFYLFGGEEGIHNGIWVIMSLQDMIGQMRRMVRAFTLRFSIRLYRGPSAFHHISWDPLVSMMEELPMLENLIFRVMDGPKPASPEIYDIPRQHFLPLQDRLGIVVDIPS
ncbi:hypothetical protein NLI96_g1195 [Meripilus lineatus]|uniref:F-box domain-containing protein n=1 Tax=Meripilus lineatus TaxID=2056292 RepID=A0AAD5YLB4_9APHY|nr:hypothetical protein NLI96_g1195 [Physisporinus lineatus]